MNDPYKFPAETCVIEFSTPEDAKKAENIGRKILVEREDSMLPHIALLLMNTAFAAGSAILYAHGHPAWAMFFALCIFVDHREIR